MSVLSTLKTQLGELARSNRYKVKINFAGIATSAGGGFDTTLTADDRYSFLVREVAIPGRTIEQIPISWMGMETSIPGDITFNDLSITFINEENFHIKKGIENWMTLISDPVNGIRTLASGANENLIDYMTEILVYPIGHATATVVDADPHYKFYGCYPKSIGDISVDTSSESAFETFDVNFNVDYWEKIIV